MSLPRLAQLTLTALAFLGPSTSAWAEEEGDRLSKSILVEGGAGVRSFKLETASSSTGFLQTPSFAALSGGSPELFWVTTIFDLTGFYSNGVVSQNNPALQMSYARILRLNSGFPIWEPGAGFKIGLGSDFDWVGFSAPGNTKEGRFTPAEATSGGNLILFGASLDAFLRPAFLRNHFGHAWLTADANLQLDNIDVSPIYQGPTFRLEGEWVFKPIKWIGVHAVLSGSRYQINNWKHWSAHWEPTTATEVVGRLMIGVEAWDFF